jgi:diguanylate cyclase (GGDEF)-like protein
VTPAESDEPISPRLLRTEHARMLLEQAGVGDPVSRHSGFSALQAMIDGLCELSQRDALTGLANRRHLSAVLHREIDRVARCGQLALLLRLEIDELKSLREAHGPAATDQVIRSVASLLSGRVRPMDTVARCTEDGFAILLPDCEFQLGLQAAERLRAAVALSMISLPSGGTVAVTLSVGGAFAPQWIRSSASLWLQRADQQLYRARTAGHNQVRLEEQLLGPVSPEERSLLFGAMDALPADQRQVRLASRATGH